MKEVELLQDGGFLFLVVNNKKVLRLDGAGKWGRAEPGWTISQAPLLDGKQMRDGLEFRHNGKLLNHVFFTDDDGKPCLCRITVSRPMGRG